MMWYIFPQSHHPMNWRRKVTCRTENAGPLALNVREEEDAFIIQFR